METFLPSPIDDDGDATGDREWDSSYLLLAALVNEDACARLLPPGVSLPPEEVLELGAGTGAMACSLLASRWSGVRYVATDMACRIANIEANAAKSKCTSLYAQPLIWGSTPPAPMSAGDATYLVLMSDLIYFHGKHLLEPDTLEPLAQTLSIALSQRRRSCALFTFRERDPEREAHFRALCVALGLAVTEPLDADYLAGLVPAATHSDVESSGPLRLWRLTPPQDSTTHVISHEAPTPPAPAATVPQHALSSAQPSVLIPQLSITALSAGSVRAHLRIKIGPDLPRLEPDLPRSEPDLPKSEPDLPRSEPDLPRWRQGALVASEREPRLVLYPNFLSASETAHLLDLSRWGALEAEAAAIFTPAATPAVSWDSGRAINAASSGRTITIHLPSPSDDPIIQAIEERCAAATGIPIHADEEPIGVRHTSPSTADECGERYCTALHIDTNQGGHFRAATVLLYLHDIEHGGETRFPLVGAAEGSEIRLAAERLADLGITAFSPSEDIEWPPLHLRKPLLDAAEAEGVGLCIQPKAGLAAVFWTHTPDGLDKYSWHAGARVPPEATDGKLIAQKFKSLPVQWRPTRKADAVRLPVELSPPLGLGLGLGVA